MKVFVFDLLPYGENLEHLRVGKELPYPLSRKHFKSEVAVKTYAEHLDAWELLDKLGYDGVGFNEHHTSPYGLMNSPNIMAASAAQRTKNIKLLIYGNLLPLHEPLRLAEELAMIDCLSNGRLISGFARGIPREYNVHNVKHSESRARFEEAYDIIMKAWTEDVFSYEGKFWSYHDVAIWPRPVQQPAPPVWTPITSSKESIEWAAAHNIPITPGLGSRGAREDIIRYYAKCLAQNGYRITPDNLTISMEAYVADSKAQAVREYGPHHLYFNRVLYSHGNTTELDLNKKTGYLTDNSTSFMRPENLAVAAALARRLSRHDDGRRREEGGDAAVGYGCRSARADHRGGRTRRCRYRAADLQSRRDAARDVRGPDPALRQGRSAGVASARHHHGAASGGGGRLAPGEAAAVEREDLRVVIPSSFTRFFGPRYRQWLIALIVAGAFFMEMLDGSVIATALPQMAQSFHENPVNLSIGMSAYLAYARDLHSGQRLDRRPLRIEDDLPERDRALHRGLGAVRFLELAVGVHRGAHRARRRRRDDGAGRAARRAARHRQKRPRQHDAVCVDSRV